MAPPTDPPDPAQPDLYWAGHSGWAMVPGFLLGVVASAAVMLSAPPVGNWINLPPDWTAFIRFWMVLIGWIVAGIVWTYRGGSFVYRLTPQCIYVDFGMVYAPVPPIPLAEVTSIECQQNVLRRWFGVGSVLIRAKGRAPLRLRGIYRPNRFADAIRSAVRAAQGE